MKLLFLACMIAVCSAIPPVPNVAETFCGDGEIEFHETEVTAMGEFMMCRDEVKQMEVQDAKYDDKDMHNRRQSLLRYDSTTSHMAYYIRGEEGKEHCAPMMRNLTFPLPSFFSWVKVANYEGQRKVREMSYDVWALTVADVRFELAVAPGTPNVPVFYNRISVEDFVFYSFKSFNATTPSDPKVFDVPPVCKGP